MRLYTFDDSGEERLGVEASEGRLVDLARAAALLGQDATPFRDMQTLIECGTSGLDAAAALLRVAA